MLKLNDNNLRTGLIIGVISSAVFVYLFDPLISITIKNDIQFWKLF